MRSLKKWFFPCVFIIVYIFLIFTVFFWNWEISDIWTTIWLQILLIIIWFLAIQTIPITYKNILLWWIWILCILLCVIAISLYSLQYGIFIFCTHVIFIVYIRERFNLISSSKLLYTRRSAHWWLWSISLLLAVTYIGTLWWVSSEINLDCNKIHDQTLGVLIRYIPNIQNNTWVINIINKIDTIWSQSFGQLLGINDWISWKILLQTGIIKNNIELSSWVNIITSQTYKQPSWLLWILWEQKNLLDILIKNQELIDGKVCTVTLEHINSISQKSGVKFITFILLIWWLSFFLRSIMFIVGIINFLILWLLFKTKWFKKTLIKEDCEKIDI